VPGGLRLQQAPGTGRSGRARIVGQQPCRFGLKGIAAQRLDIGLDRFTNEGTGTKHGIGYVPLMEHVAKAAGGSQGQSGFVQPYPAPPQRAVEIRDYEMNGFYSALLRGAASCHRTAAKMQDVG
jgi:hypothetical protein